MKDKKKEVEMVWLRNPYIKVRLFYCVCLILPTVLFAQVDTAWIRRYNGPGNSVDEASALAVDNAGNVYVTGGSDGSGTSADYATIKYDASGNVQWVQRYNGPGNDWDFAKALAVDATGNVYVTGLSVGSGTNVDYLTIKYDASGNVQWVQRYNGPGNGDDGATAIAVDAAGNVYVTGYSSGSGTGDDYLTIKYDASGNVQWVQRYNGPYVDGNDYATAIAVDNAGNVYVTGYSLGIYFDYATIKYNPLGVQQWVQRYNGPGHYDDKASALAVDAAGNVYVTGSSYGSGTGHDYATIKYNPLGVQQWVQRYNGPANDWDEAYALAVDNAGNVYVTGKSWAIRVIRYDYATIKYNSLGVVRWVQIYNGPGNSVDEAYALAVDNAGNVYVTGKSYSVTAKDNYMTIKYDSSGVLQWVQIYNGPGNDCDIASTLAVDNAGNVYVTGRSEGSGTASDYLTIKYVQTPSGIEESTTLDFKHILLNAEPNPFKTQTTIWYSLLTEGSVCLSIYDVSGKKVKTLKKEPKQPGTYLAHWNGTDDNGKTLGPGIYFLVLEVNEEKFQKKVVILK